MRAGPFMCPELVDFVKEGFVPTDAVPKGKTQRELGLVREKFVEPGLVVLDAEGKVKGRIDKLSTLQSFWLLAWLERVSGLKRTKREGHVDRDSDMRWLMLDHDEENSAKAARDDLEKVLGAGP